MWTGGASGLRSLHQEPRSGLALLPVLSSASVTDQTRHQHWLDVGQGGAQEQGPVNPGQLKHHVLEARRHRVFMGWELRSGPGGLEPAWAPSCPQSAGPGVSLAVGTA